MQVKRYYKSYALVGGLWQALQMSQFLNIPSDKMFWNVAIYELGEQQYQKIQRIYNYAYEISNSLSPTNTRKMSI